MTNLPAQSRISELKREIDAIANAPKATQQKAIEYAMRLIAQHPGQQNQDERVAEMFMLDLTACLEGVDLDILERLVDPKRVRSKFLPSVPEVAEFVDTGYEPKRRDIHVYQEEIKRIEEREVGVSATPEEREARYQRAREVTKVMRDAAYKLRMERAGIKAIQVHDGNALVEALKTFDA